MTTLGGFVRPLLRMFAETRGLGSVLGPDSLVRLAPSCKHCPDAVILKRGRLPRPRPKQLHLVPDGVVEVLSSSNRLDDLEEKRPAYRAAGVAEIWFIDPDERQVLIDRKRGRGYKEEIVRRGKVESVVLTGFWLDASWLWMDPLPDLLTCLNQVLRND